MKTVEIGFTGVAREIAGTKSIPMELEDQASYRDIVRLLAIRYPGFIGTLIAPDGQSLLSANLFNRNGEEPVMPDEMDQLPKDGEKIVVLYFIVGG